MNFFMTFLHDDAGAVTVDWVVLTAALVGMVLGLTALMGTSLNTAGSSINAKVISVVTDGI